MAAIMTNISNLFIEKDKYQLAEEIYNKLFGCGDEFYKNYPHAELYRDLAVINLGPFIITIERALT